MLEEKPCLDSNKGVYSFLFIVMFSESILRIIEKNIEVPVDLVSLHIK